MPEPVVASYCTTFLKREMLHIYRQVSSLQNYRTFVMTKARAERGVVSLSRHRVDSGARD